MNLKAPSATLPMIVPALGHNVVTAPNAIEPLQSRLRFSRRTTRASPYPLESRLANSGKRIGTFLDIRV